MHNMYVYQLMHIFINRIMMIFTAEGTDKGKLIFAFLHKIQSISLIDLFIDQIALWLKMLTHLCV